MLSFELDCVIPMDILGVVEETTCDGRIIIRCDALPDIGDSVFAKGGRLGTVGRVFGTGTVLDSARFRYFLSTKIGADIRNIHGYTAGEHGEAQFAVWSSVHVSGMHLASYCEKCNISLDKEEVMRETISSGAQVIKRKGVTNFAIAAIVAELAATVLKNRRSIFSVTSLLEDYYGIGDVAISVPSFVGEEGVVGKLMYDFTQEELDKLRATAKKIREFMDTLKI